MFSEIGSIAFHCNVFKNRCICFFCDVKAELTDPPSWDVDSLKKVFGQGLGNYSVLVDVVFQRLLECAKEDRAKRVFEELLSVSRVLVRNFMAFFCFL